MSGPRGPSGEVTVRVASGDAARWSRLTRVTLRKESGSRGYGIERARAYRDRLVLKLQGIDDAGAARQLRGCSVAAPADEVPELPEGVFYAARLVGLTVTAGDGETLGTVVDVVVTGGTDVLAVEEPDGRELLVPLAPEVVTEVDVSAGRIVVELPEGLRELNRPVAGPAEEEA